MAGLPPWVVPQEAQAPVPQALPSWAGPQVAPPVDESLAGPPLPPWMAPPAGAPPIAESYPEQVPPPEQTLAPPGLPAPLPEAPPAGGLQQAQESGQPPVPGWQVWAGVPRGTPSVVPSGPPWGRNGPRMDPEAESIAQAGALRGRQQEAMAAGESQATADYAQSLRDNEAKRQREQDIQDGAMASAQEAWKRAGDAKVDPNRWWASRSSSQKVTTFIGAALGGWLGVRNGTNKNAFLDGITQAVHDDIAQQEFDIDSGARAAQGQLSLLGMNQQIFTSRQAARQATAAGLFDAALRQTMADGKKYESPITGEETQLALVQLQKQRDGLRAAAGQSEFENRLKLDEQARKDAETRSQIAKNYADANATKNPAVSPAAAEHEALKVVPNLLVPVLDERGRPVMQYQEVQDEQGNPLKPTPVINQRTGQPEVDPKTGKPLYTEQVNDKTGSTSVENVKVGTGPDGKPIYEPRVVKMTPKTKNFVGRDPGESKEIAETIGGYRMYQQAMDELDQVRQQYGREFWKSSEGAQAYDQARQHVMFATLHMYSDVYGVKRTTQAEMNKIDHEMPKAGRAWSINDGENAIKRAKEFGERSFRTRTDQFGVPYEAALAASKPDSEKPPIPFELTTSEPEGQVIADDPNTRRAQGYLDEPAKPEHRGGR